MNICRHDDIFINLVTKKRIRMEFGKFKVDFESKVELLKVTFKFPTIFFRQSIFTNSYFFCWLSKRTFIWESLFEVKILHFAINLLKTFSFCFKQSFQCYICFVLTDWKTAIIYHFIEKKKIYLGQFYS